MKLLFGLLLLAVAPALLAQEKTLGLVAYLSPDTPNDVREELEAETKRLLSLPGLRIEWRDIRTIPSSATFDIVVVLQYSGLCRPTASPVSTHDPGSLGFVRGSGGVIMPFVYVSCGMVMREVARALGYPLQLGHRSFGRALARVTAHEIYHYLSQSATHDSEGLSKARLYPEDLLRPDFGFCAGALRRMAERQMIDALPDDGPIPPILATR